jgi:hypothetical protein
MKTAARQQHGAVLVFALLVLVVGATLLGGIAQLAVTQSIAGQGEWELVAKRIRLENSRSLARQYMLTQMWRGFGRVPNAALNNSATGATGGFAITNVEPPFGYWLSLQQNANDRINPFTLFERGGFQSAWVGANLRSGSGDAAADNVRWNFQVRTRSPIAAGFAFVNQRPTDNNGLDCLPTQRINMLATNYASGFVNVPRIPVSSVTNIAASNAALTLADLGGLLLPKAEAPFGDVTSPPYSPGSVTTNMLVGTNAASISLDLDDYDYAPGGDPADSPRLYEVPHLVDVIGGGATNYAVPVTQLVLRNSAGAGTSSATSAVQIVIPDTQTSLTDVVLSGSNMRETYLYRRGSATPQLLITTTGGNPTFRIGMTLDCSANLAISGTPNIRGGIRSGSLVTKSTGDLTIIPETSPTWRLDAIADRMMWLEDQRER